MTLKFSSGYKKSNVNKFAFPKTWPNITYTDGTITITDNSDTPQSVTYTGTRTETTYNGVEYYLYDM